MDAWKLCTLHLLQKLCRAGWVWDWYIMMLLAPRKSMKRETGTRKCGCCFFLHSLQLQTRTHRFAGDQAQI